jgi:tRNA threonylcarbamoyladenosine biosynthesis protein TsaE
VVIETFSAEETKTFGEKIGRSLKPGDIVALTGELGAGKTTLIQGIARGLKINEHVTSPTFTLINEYKGIYPFFHLDLYRLDDPSQIEDLGIEEYFDNKDGIMVIEWAEKLGKLMPNNAMQIKMESTGESERKIWLSSEFQARLK